MAGVRRGSPRASRRRVLHRNSCLPRTLPRQLVLSLHPPGPLAVATARGLLGGSDNAHPWLACGPRAVRNGDRRSVTPMAHAVPNATFCVGDPVVRVIGSRVWWQYTAPKRAGTRAARRRVLLCRAQAVWRFIVELTKRSMTAARFQTIAGWASLEHSFLSRATLAFVVDKVGAKDQQLEGHVDPLSPLPDVGYAMDQSLFRTV